MFQPVHKSHHQAQAAYSYEKRQNTLEIKKVTETSSFVNTSSLTEQVKANVCVL
jgi:hypothetical protein